LFVIDKKGDLLFCAMVVYDIQQDKKARRRVATGSFLFRAAKFCIKNPKSQSFV